MADILIRGMELPKDCGKCFVGDRTICADGCVLIELPEHGDLIDRDAFRAENEYYLNREFINPKYEDTLDDLLKDAPVVIPSNKEDAK
jgi:hypothetical protein